MDKRDKISIRMNGKETLIPREDEKAMEEVVTSQEEQAATAEVYEYEHSQQEKVIKPEAWKKHPYYKKKKKKKKLSSPVKNIIVSVITALLLGLLLGFLLLRMFVGITESDGATDNPVQYTGAANTENTAPVTTDGVNAISLPAVEAYVVQAGYFTSREKAEEWSQNYIEKGYPTVIWERENDVFLFTGLAKSYDAANEKAAPLLKDDLQTYIKPWEVAATEKVNVKGAEPLSGFADLFYGTMDGKNTAEEWRQMAGSLPENETFKELKAAIQKLSESDNRSKQDILLLQVWKSYDNILEKK